MADFSEEIRLKPAPGWAVNAYCDRGMAYWGMGDNDRAIADADEAIRLKPDLAAAYANRGAAYESKGDHDRAISDADEAIRLKPDLAAAYLNRGAAYEDKGDYDRAIADADQAIRLKPELFKAYINRANAYELKGDLDRTLADYDEAVRLKPGDPDALNERGYVYALKGDYDRAITDLNEALRLKGDFANALDSRGYAYLGRGDLESAMSDLNEALRLNPKLAESYAHRGRALEKRGDLKSAMADFEKALSLKKELPEAIAGRDRVGASLAALAAASATTPVAAASPIYSGRRVALIVANGAYRDAALANPKVDADLVAASLKKIGFAVTEKKDLGLDAFEQAIGDFAEASRGADVALFYFAGHGFSIAAGGRQENVLMATDADFQAKTGLALERGGEPLEHVEETIIGHAKATLIFVDACRNVPALASRGDGARGFAPFDASAFDGAFVVVSTRQGKTAADGADGQGSPFARAFADVLPTPGLRIEDAAARIREKVRAETAGEQIPDVIRSDLPEGGVVLMAGAP